MKLYAAENLTVSTVAPCAPWDFVPTETITLRIRKDKISRQEWYKTPTTKHCFYSGLEGLTTTGRITKENPPRAILAFVADYDVPISDERLKEAIESMPVKPTYIETSIGGNRRLVWILERPILIASYDFAVFVLQRATEWLKLHLLPGLDEAAFHTPSRLYCVGDKWERTQYTQVPVAKSQSFFVECGRVFRFRSTDGVTIGLDLVEKALKEKFGDAFDWPTEFTVGSQGPSFWVPGSTSSNSAIVKPDGMFSFAAHAEKPFHSWGDILGREFVRKFSEDSLTQATDDIWFDGKRYHRRNSGVYISMDRIEFNTFLKVTARLSSKTDDSGHSTVERALDHINSHQRVAGAAPFVFRRPGPIEYQGKRYLNTYEGKPIPPADGDGEWGKGFPWCRDFFDSYLTTKIQLEYYLAWGKYYYESAFLWLPRPGQTCIFMGEAGTGKTLANRYIWGRLVGGFADAASFIVGGSGFNSHLLCQPHWVLDDDTPNANSATSNQAHAIIKKLVANNDFEHSKKYEVSSMVEWCGRVGITANLDAVSARIVGPLDEGTIGKINIFRCTSLKDRGNFKFPPREKMLALLDQELPHFGRFLLNWKVPDHIKKDNRFGIGAYQEPSLFDQTQQSSPAAIFKELLFDTLAEWFRTNEGDCWKGSATRVLQLLSSDIRNEHTIRTLKAEQVNRHLEQLQREGVLKCSTETEDKTRIRIWTFYRPE